MMQELQRDVAKLKTRTAGIDSGFPLAALPGVIDPSWNGTGEPQVQVNGAVDGDGNPVYSGPFPFVSGFTPKAGQDVLLQPVGVQQSYIVVGAYSGTIVPGSTGTTVTYSETAPANPATGDVWYQTDANNNVIQVNVYTGTEWVIYETNAEVLTDGTVTPSQLADGAVTQPKIAGGAVALSNLGTDVTALIDSKSTTKVSLGPSVPASANAGDLWIQTNSAGTSVTGIFTCTTAYTSGGTAADWSSETLSARALGAPYVYQQSATPDTANNASNPPQLDDLWINTGSGNVIEQMTGGTAASPVWTQFQIGSGAIAGGAVGAAQLDPDVTARTLGGNTVSIGQTQPASAINGDTWIETNASSQVTAFWTYNGTWIESTISIKTLGGISVTASSTAPSGPNTGDLWIDEAAGNVLEQWNGSTWTPYQVGSGAIAGGAVGTGQLANGAVGLAQLGGAVTARSIGGITTTVGTTAPATGNTAGDIFINETTGQISQWSGSAWTAITFGTGTVSASAVNGLTITGNTINGAYINGGTITGATFDGTNWVENQYGSFLYSGTPAVGNLVASTAPVAGNDAAWTSGSGNAYQSGICTYQVVSGVTYVTKLSAFANASYGYGGVAIAATGTAAPYSPAGIAGSSSSTSNALTVSSGSETSSDNPAQIILISQANSGVTGGTVAVYGQTTFYDSIYMGGVGAIITADSLHSTSGQNSFTTNPSGMPGFQYFMDPDGFVNITGCIQNPSSGGPTGTAFYTLPSAYWPKSRHMWPVSVGVGFTAMSISVSVETNGQMMLRNASGTLAANTVIDIGGRYPSTQITGIN